MEFGRIFARLAFGKVEIDRAHFYEAGDRASVVMGQGNRPAGIGDLVADAFGRVPAGEEGRKIGVVVDMPEGVGEGRAREQRQLADVLVAGQGDGRHAGSSIAPNPWGRGQPGAVAAMTLNNSPISCSLRSFCARAVSAGSAPASPSRMPQFIRKRACEV